MFSLSRAGVQSLLGKLRSCKPGSSHGQKPAHGHPKTAIPRAEGSVCGHWLKSPLCSQAAGPRQGATSLRHAWCPSLTPSLARESVSGNSPLPLPLDIHPVLSACGLLEARTPWGLREGPITEDHQQETYKDRNLFLQVWRPESGCGKGCLSSGDSGVGPSRLFQLLVPPPPLASWACGCITAPLPPCQWLLS